MSMIQTIQPALINNQYTMKKKISSGSFGTVFLGQDNILNINVAIKVEKTYEGESSSLKRESYILNLLNGVAQVPRLYWFGKGVYSGADVMVLQFLGRDLTYFLKSIKRFSLRCVINIALQSLEILENIHSRSIIHRDIKPENMLVGRDKECNLIYMVDFGVSKVFRNQNGQHVPMTEGKPFIGTTRYASIAAHKNIELGRKDDLESLGYVLIFLLKGKFIMRIPYKGSLPWQNLKVTKEEKKMQDVGQMKMKLKSDEICSGLPIEFIRYFDYVKKLAFSAQPDYRYLKSLFEKVQEQQQFPTNGQVFDWDLRAYIGSQLNLVTIVPKQQSTNRIPKRKYSEEHNSGMNSLLNIKRQDFSRLTGGSSNQQDDQSQKNNKSSVPSLQIYNPIQDQNVVTKKYLGDNSFNETFSSNDNAASVMIRFQGSRFTFKSSNFPKYKNQAGSSFHVEGSNELDIFNKGTDFLEIPNSKFSSFNQKKQNADSIDISQLNQTILHDSNYRKQKEDFSESNLNLIDDSTLSEQYSRLQQQAVFPQLKKRLYSFEEIQKKRLE